MLELSVCAGLTASDLTGGAEEEDTEEGTGAGRAEVMAGGVMAGSEDEEETVGAAEPVVATVEETEWDAGRTADGEESDTIGIRGVSELLRVAGVLSGSFLVLVCTNEWSGALPVDASTGWMGRCVGS